MKRWKEDIHGVSGLDYFTIKNCPMRETKFGPALEINLGLIEMLAARMIIEKGFPLRGMEVLFLRKTIGCSMAAFAQKLGLSVGAIQKWEKAATTRLLPINEVAVRTLMAEELDIDIPAKFSKLVGIAKTPKKVELTA